MATGFWPSRRRMTLAADGWHGYHKGHIDRFDKFTDRRRVNSSNLSIWPCGTRVFLPVSPQCVPAATRKTRVPQGSNCWFWRRACPSMTSSSKIRRFGPCGTRILIKVKIDTKRLTGQNRGTTRRKSSIDEFTAYRPGKSGRRGNRRRTFVRIDKIRHF